MPYQADETGAQGAQTDLYWRSRVSEAIANLYGALYIAHGRDDAQRMLELLDEWAEVELPF